MEHSFDRFSLEDFVEVGTEGGDAGGEAIIEVAELFIEEDCRSDVLCFFEALEHGDGCAQLGLVYGDGFDSRCSLEGVGGVGNYDPVSVSEGGEATLDDLFGGLLHSLVLDGGKKNGYDERRSDHVTPELSRFYLSGDFLPDWLKKI